MKIYDLTFLISAVNLEVAKNKRFENPFTIVKFSSVTTNIIQKILGLEEYRASDLVVKKDNHSIFILLNGTEKELADKFIDRIQSSLTNEEKENVDYSLLDHTGYNKKDFDHFIN